MALIQAGVIAVPQVSVAAVPTLSSAMKMTIFTSRKHTRVLLKLGKNISRHRLSNWFSTWRHRQTPLLHDISHSSGGQELDPRSHKVDVIGDSGRYFVVLASYVLTPAIHMLVKVIPGLE
jgi:hypothetical protein